MDEQDIQKAQEDIKRAMRDLNAFGVASQDTTKALKMQNKGYAGLIKAGTELGKAFGEITKKTYAGAKGVDTFNGAISGTAKAVTALMLAFGPFGWAIKVATVALAGFAKFLTASNDAAAKQFKAFQDLSQVGATTASGLEDMGKGMLKLGYGVEEVEKYTRLITENALGLALFGRGVARGRQQFEDLANTLVRGDVAQELYKLGMTPDTINEATARYIKIQSRLGVAQTMSQDQLTSSTGSYIKELDILRRLTGANNESLQAAQDELLSQGRYRAALLDAEISGDQARIAEAKKVQMAYIALTNAGQKEAARALADSYTGFIGTSEDSMRGFLSTQGKLPGIIKNSADSFDLMNQTLLARGNTARQFRQIEMAGGFATENIGNFAESLDGLQLAQNMTRENFLRLSKEQRDTILNEETSNTNAVGVLQSQIDSKTAMVEFVQKGIGPATTAAEFFAKALENATSILPGAGKTKKEATTTGPKPEVGKQDELSAVVDKIIQAESNNKAFAQNPRSSAYGLGQLTKSTFMGLQSDDNSKLKGKTWDDYKKDPALQRVALEELTARNNDMLKKTYVKPNAAQLYLAHFLGYGSARDVLNAKDETQLSTILSDSYLKNNPEVFNKVKTVGELKKWAGQKMGVEGFATGGIAAGPASGYSATLHGTEAIVPLPDGKTIPVEIRNQQSTEEQLQLMGKQISKLDEVVRLLSRSLYVQEAGLRASM